MHFNVLTLYGVALAARGVQAEMSANQLVDSFSAFTETSNKIIGTSENIDASMVEDAIPKMSADFEVLIKNAVDAVAGISTMERTPDTFTKAEQDKICVSMKNSVDVAKDVVSSIVDSVEIFGNNAITKTVVRVLQVVEKVLESLTRGTLELVPDCSSDIEKRLKSLQDKLQKGVERFPLMDAEMDDDDEEIISMK